ncbi:MAG: secretin N-terminal domain-containing protein [Rhodocyclaceae bacterium]|jgi:general secretion pathway protein D|nr:secretin N-terminal domain-containing protein [Rhodocyclaceae bacterium]
MTLRRALPSLLCACLAACAQVPRQAAAPAHLGRQDLPAAIPAPAGIPAPVAHSFSLPPPKPGPKTETYSVVVSNVSVQDLLFALARDARLNVDVHPGLTGTVTLNALNQTLPQLLARIAKQVDMRFELDGQTLTVTPDTPILRTYQIDYVNLGRNVSGTVSTNTQISTSNASMSGGGGSGTGSSGGNVSSTRIENLSRNQFWESIEKNVADILRETDKYVPTVGQASATGQLVAASDKNGAGSARGPADQAIQAQGNTNFRFLEAASVIVNKETGVVTVRATSRQQERVQEFLDRVMASAHRQVLIEATIVEVSLSDSYQQGIDWSRLGGKTWGISGPTLGSNVGSAVTPFSITYASGNLKIDLSVLEAFGTVKVLSSPKLAVLNNQTALLKVVDEFVYFNVKAETITTANVGTNTTFTTTPQSVSVGMVMAVTPQVSDHGDITLNVRPTISSISALKEDPNPALAEAGIKNEVPQIRTREIESVLRLKSGEVAILGGLMEDRIDYKTGRIPLVGAVPILGELFTERNNAVHKTELVVFLRPVVMERPGEAVPSVLRERLPGADFFSSAPRPGTRNFPSEPLILPAAP